ITDVEFNMEIKERGLVTRLKRLIVDRSLQHRTIVSAFRSEDLINQHDQTAAPGWDELAVLKPEIRFALLANRRDISMIGAHQFALTAFKRGAFAINPEYTGTTS